MVNLLVKEKVKDHDKWLKVFIEDAKNRNGSLGGTIYQFAEDPNQHVILFEWKDRKSIDAFFKVLESDAMKPVFEKAGLIDHEHHICGKATIFKQ
jgi:hypothetical protein